MARNITGYFTCNNKDFRIIRMSNTVFVCCDKFAQFCTEEEFTPKEMSEIFDFKVCPFCGYKLSSL